MTSLNLFSVMGCQTGRGHFYEGPADMYVNLISSPYNDLSESRGPQNLLKPLCLYCEVQCSSNVVFQDTKGSKMLPLVRPPQSLWPLWPQPLQEPHRQIPTHKATKWRMGSRVQCHRCLVLYWKGRLMGILQRPKVRRSWKLVNRRGCEKNIGPFREDRPF